MLSPFSTPRSSACTRSSFMIGRKWEARPNELTTLNLADGFELHFSTTPPEIVLSYKTKVHRLIILGFLGHRVLANAPRNHMLLNGVPLPAITQYPCKQHSVSLRNSEYPQIRVKGQTSSLSSSLCSFQCWFEPGTHYEIRAGFHCEAPSLSQPLRGRIKSLCHHALLKVKIQKHNY